MFIGPLGAGEVGQLTNSAHLLLQICPLLGRISDHFLGGFGPASE
jgi:hypothetical protein